MNKNCLKDRNAGDEIEQTEAIWINVYDPEMRQLLRNVQPGAQTTRKVNK